MKHAKKLIILILVISIVINLELRFATDDNYVLLNLKVDNEAFKIGRASCRERV